MFHVKNISNIEIRTNSLEMTSDSGEKKVKPYFINKLLTVQIYY